MRDFDLLLVDDDPGVIRALSKALNGVGRLRFANNGPDALRRVAEAQPDLVLLDAEMPGMSGFQVCQTLKDHAATADVPIIFVTSHVGPEFEVSGFEMGAADFIAKPIEPRLVLARVRAQLRVKRMADQLRQAATFDALTGVPNRRRFDDALSSEWLRARRTGAPLALLSIDVDHFKRFNDRYGHPAGDSCLQQVAQALASVARRPGDLVARCGGEEFAILLPDTTREGAAHLARRVLSTIEGLDLPHATSPTSRHVTVSVGVGAVEPGLSNLEMSAPGEPKDLVQAADDALYAAKRAGRAQAVVLGVTEARAMARRAEAAARAIEAARVAA